MPLLDALRRPSRPYSKRRSMGLERRAMLSARVHEIARRDVSPLASRRGMSVSEYVARVLYDHLRQAVNVNRPAKSGIRR